MKQLPKVITCCGRCPYFEPVNETCRHLDFGFSGLDPRIIGAGCPLEDAEEANHDNH